MVAIVKKWRLSDPEAFFQIFNTIYEVFARRLINP